MALYEITLKKISLYTKAISPYATKTITAVKCLFSCLLDLDRDDAIALMNEKLIEAIIKTIDEYYEELKKAAKIANTEKWYLSHIQYFVSCAVRFFLYFLEKVDAHPGFFSLVREILKELLLNQGKFPHRAVEISRLQFDVLKISYDLHKGIVTEAVATESLWLRIEMDKLLAQADSRRGHSNHAETLTPFSTELNAKRRKPGNQNEQQNDFLKFASTLQQTIYHYWCIQRQRNYKLRFFSDRRDSRKQACEKVISLIKSYKNSDGRKSVSFVRDRVQAVIQEIEESQRSSVLGRIGLTQSILARKLRVVLTVFSAPHRQVDAEPQSEPSLETQSPG